MRFSIIIPAYNEEKFLPRLLDSIAVGRANYSGGPDQIEVIVADNSSTDRTVEVAAARGARVVTIRSGGSPPPATVARVPAAERFSALLMRTQPCIPKLLRLSSRVC